MIVECHFFENFCSALLLNGILSANPTGGMPCRSCKSFSCLVMEWNHFRSNPPSKIVLVIESEIICTHILPRVCWNYMRLHWFLLNCFATCVTILTLFQVIGQPWPYTFYSKVTFTYGFQHQLAPAGRYYYYMVTLENN